MLCSLFLDPCPAQQPGCQVTRDLKYQLNLPHPFCVDPPLPPLTSRHYLARAARNQSNTGHRGQREEGEPVLRSLAWPETSDRRERGVRATGGHCLHQHLCCGEDTQQQRHSSFYEITEDCLIRLKCCCDYWVHGEPASDRLRERESLGSSEKCSVNTSEPSVASDIAAC